MRFVSVLAAAGMSWLACNAHAAEPLRLEEAIERALVNHPALAAEAARLRAVQAQAEQESLPPPLVIAAQLEDVAGTGPLSGVDEAQLTVQLERRFELGGKRAARRALGAAAIARQRHELVMARLDVVTRVRERFVETAIDQQRLRDAEARLAEARVLRDEVAAWVEAGRNPVSDLLAAEMAVTEAGLQLEHAGHALEAARVALAASLGLTEPDFDGVAMDIGELPPVPALAVLAERLQHTPEVRAAEFEAEAAAARRRVAAAAAKPDLTLGVGVRRIEAVDDQVLLLSMSMPLGNHRRAAPVIAEAEARSAAIGAVREQARVERHQELFGMYQELVHARSEVEALRGELLPRAAQALEFATRAFRAGRFSYMAVAQAAQTLMDLKVRHTDALARFHLRRLAVERFTATVDGEEFEP
jgi:cobalt-zinc-cadmium efflux system outer membrane protein